MEFSRNGYRVAINIADRDALEAAVRAAWAAGRGFALATLNLDHLVKLDRDAAFARAYAAQDLVVADGRPIVWLSRLARRPVSLMPGSDLVLPLARLAAAHGQGVAFLGSTAQALDDAERVLMARVPMLEVRAKIAPPMGFDPEGPAAEAMLRDLAQGGVGLCFLALGAPKQERLAARGRAVAPNVGFASVGAGLDFLGGRQRRAPRLVRALALEWLWRAATDPVRLVPRYVRCALILPRLVREAWQQR